MFYWQIFEGNQNDIIAFTWYSIETFTISRIVADNFDLSVKDRIQTKEHSNQSIHWTQQYAIKDRVVREPSADDDQPQCKLADLDLQKLLPDSDVQVNFRRDCVIPVSRILTSYMPAFAFLKDTVIKHIPHPYSEEQSQKSETVSVTSFICSLVLIY